MRGTPTLYCLTCGAFRAVEDWRERGEALVIELSPCGHVLQRNAGLEWPIETKRALIELGYALTDRALGDRR